MIIEHVRSFGIDAPPLQLLKTWDVYYQTTMEVRH